MLAVFLDDNKTNDDLDGKENGKKYMFILTNNNFARTSRYFLHFFVVVVPPRLETSRNFTLYGAGEQNQKNFSFLF